MEPGITFVNERDAPRPREQPSVEVRSWRLLKAPSGDLHLATLRDLKVDSAVIRLTSAVVSIDVAERVATTSSGRRYWLSGPPEDKPLERELIHGGAAALGLRSGLDVSDETWHRMRRDE